MVSKSRFNRAPTSLKLHKLNNVLISSSDKQRDQDAEDPGNRVSSPPHTDGAATTDSGCTAMDVIFLIPRLWLSDPDDLSIVHVIILDSPMLPSVLPIRQEDFGPRRQEMPMDPGMARVEILSAVLSYNLNKNSGVRSQEELYNGVSSPWNS